MSLSIAPLETIAAEAVTGLIISAGAKGVAATILKRAAAILAIVTAVSAINSGNTVTGMSALTTALGSADLDPGEALALQGLLTQLANQASLLSATLGAGSIMGTVVSAIYANIATGVSAACNAEIAKYGAPAPAVVAAKVA